MPSIFEEFICDRASPTHLKKSVTVKYMSNAANKTFDIPNNSGSSSDYMRNKKSKLMYCNRSGHCNNKGVSSYAEKNLIQNGRMIEEPVDGVTYDLHSNLVTQLNYNNVLTISDLSGNKTTIDMNARPLYYVYNIDPKGSMFGKTVCAENNMVNYRVPYVPIPPQTVYKN